MKESEDVFGSAIHDFITLGKAEDIIVASDLCDDDVIPVAYLLRDSDEMPELEKIALNHCRGKILDIGAGAGIHSLELLKRKQDVKAIDISPGSVEYMQSLGIPAKVQDFTQLTHEKYDTLLLLMNGIGIAGSLENLESFLEHAVSCLNDGGKIICDSTNVMYLYENEDGSVWMDLNSTYFGDFKFQMKYKEKATNWFDWLYVDYNMLLEKANNVGLEVTLLHENEEHYLVELTRKKA